MAKISIALCTYNGERFLQQQLDSFVTQRRSPDELIVCDDRSSDETTGIVERFGARAPFEVSLVVNEKNIGSTRNFEKAISLCTGDLIFLSDQDDVWLPQKVERIEAGFAKDEGVGMIFSDAEIVDEDLRPLGRNLSSLTFHQTSRGDLRDGKQFESLLWQNFVTGATAAFRASFREILVPTPVGVPNLVHDGWIALSIANEARIVFIDEPLIKYRQHGSQQIGLRIRRENDRKEFFETTMRSLREEPTRLNMMQEILEKHPRFKATPALADFMRSKQEYIEHCAVRMNLSSSRLRRVGPILKELLTGRYGRYSRGWLSAAKDALEK